MSSTASNINAPPAVASSPWPQTPAATQNNSPDNGGGPFAALVDAAATAPDTATAQPTPQPSAPRASTAADQPAAKFSTRRTNGATGATQSVTPNAQARADVTKNANAAATPVPSSNATVNPSPAQNAPADPASAAAPADTTGGTALGALAGAAATVVNDATANAATPDAKAKTSSDNGDHDESGSATDATPPPPPPPRRPTSRRSPLPPPLSPMPSSTRRRQQQPGPRRTRRLAARPQPAQHRRCLCRCQDRRIEPGCQQCCSGIGRQRRADDARRQDAALAQDVKISAAGQDTKAAAPAQDARTAIAAQDARIATPTAKAATPAQGAKATVSGKQTPSTGSNAPAANSNNADAASPAGATDGQTWNGSAAPQGQARANSDTTITSQSGGNAATRIDALASTPASDAGGSPAAQSGWNAAKAATDGLPNFGIVAQPGRRRPRRRSGTAAAATVPIAGLAVAIASRAQAGSSQFDIRLDPPELGRIDVRLDVDRDGQVTSHVTVDRADTLQLLQSQQPQLERALEQAGLKTADNGLQFTLRDQSFAGQNGGQRRRRAAEPGAACHSRRRPAGHPGNANLFPRRPRQRHRYPRVNSNSLRTDHDNDHRNSDDNHSNHHRCRPPAPSDRNSSPAISIRS